MNNDKDNVDNFKSRYLTDFEPVDCLGKGGYGVVFEAKNKIDDCNYAIKRIALPDSQDLKNRVMGEAIALANMDHQNIVRYFNAWLECPPAGWQEKYDSEWMNMLLSSGFTDINQNETKVIDISDCSTESSNCSDSNDAKEEVLNGMNDSTHTESIVFEDIASARSKEEDKRKRQRSSSLDLNNKSNARKSPKMFLYIQMQLCQRLSLREWLKNLSVQDYLEGLRIFHQIVDAVEYMHLKGLIHRDLKPSNIFFSIDNKIKVGDFGLATTMTEAHISSENTECFTLKNKLHTANVGTSLYMAPEQMKRQDYNYKVDIYSLGIILFELLTPFMTEMERTTTLINLKNSLFPKDFDINYPAEYNLLAMMLDANPNNRPTTLGIKAWPPLSEYQKECEFILNVVPNNQWHFQLPSLLGLAFPVASGSSGES